MKVTTNPTLQAPRSLMAPKINSQEVPDGPGGPDKGPGFGDRFMSSLDRTSEKVSDVLTPLGIMFVGGAVGRIVGGVGLGTVGSLFSAGAAGPMSQVGGLAGGLAGSMLGYRYGAQIKDKPGNLIENVTGNSRAGRAILTTAYTAALGGVITGLALGGFAPGPMAVGAGITLAGLGGYAAWQAKN
jgi:hypothetical protein